MVMNDVILNDLRIGFGIDLITNGIVNCIINILDEYSLVRLHET